MNMFILFGILISFIVVTFAFLGTWTYRDAKKRNLNAGLWTAIVLLVPNLMGLIIYFLVARKDEMIRCNKCGSMVPGSSNYCMTCGNEFKEDIRYYRENRESNSKGLMIGFIIYFIVIIIIFMGFVLIVFRDGDLKAHSGISIGSIENNIGDKWNVSYISSTKEFTRKIKIEDNNPSRLYIESECGKGKLSLRLVQGDIERTIDLSPKNDGYQFDLSIFKDGEVKLYLIGDNAKNVKFKSYWE